MKRPPPPILWLLVLLPSNIAAAPAKAPADAIPADQAVKSFELEPGLVAQLVASEPLVISPCAVAWDERGRMFVAENRGYPTGGPKGSPIGRIAMLEDTDGDGLPDKRTEFATELTFPNGVMPWRGGLIVTCAPDVLFLKDTDGDGKADSKEVLLTGFATDRSTQLRVNAPTLSPDGWVYLAGGLSGGKVFSPKHAEKGLDLARGDLKFRPDTGELELTDGKGQFGMTFDEAGHRFICMNRSQVQHAPLPARYLAHNPRVVPPGVLQNCPDLVLNPLLGTTDAGAKIYPISSNITTADSHNGFYSAACAVHIARGDALPSEYIGKAWSCDPTGNLVRYDELIPTGGTFHAQRVRDKVEAMRSRDDWFRPVYLSDGPDGALYVCDMYRRTIEHPDYLPEEVRKRTDFEGGKEMGRIWRITRSDATGQALAESAKKSIALLHDAGDENLLRALRSSNGWTRDTAFRLISKHPSESIGAKLISEAASDTAPPATVIAAMNLLSNNDHLDEATLLAALKHRDARVRENAVRLSEPRFAKSSLIAQRVRALADDPAVPVRYAVALALTEMNPAPNTSREVPAEGVVEAAVKIAMRDADDKWFRAAILTSMNAPDANRTLLSSLLKKPMLNEGVLELIRTLAVWSGGSGQPSDPGIVQLLSAPELQDNFDARAALVAGLGETESEQIRSDVTTHAARHPGLVSTVAEAKKIVADSVLPLARRLRAVEVLRIAADPQNEAALLPLVSASQPTDLSLTAVRALAQPQHPAIAGTLLAPERWREYSPALRSTVISSLAGRAEFAPFLLDSLESSAIPVSALNASQREGLKNLKDETLRARASKIFANAAPGDRQKAFEESKSVLTLKPIPGNGKRMFLNHCSTCHRLEHEGFAVGPDLFGIRNQPKETILLHIIIPDQEVAPNFTAYTCVTKAGRSLNGILTADTPTAVTLKQALGLEETLPREQIQSLTVSPASLMPSGLEKAMSKQDLADLLAYLRGEQ